MNVELKNIHATELKADPDGRTLVGYAAAFGNRDAYGDIIERGAFAKTIKENQARIKTLYNHMQPIGRPTLMREDAKGLYTESKISRTPRGDEILELVRDGVITEMSIGYQAIKEGRNENGERMLKEVKLFEFSAVDFAANEQAVISGVKSLAEMMREGKNGTLDIASINDAIHTLQKLIDTTDSEPSGDTPTEDEPSLIDTQLSELGDMIHEIAEAAHV